MLRATRFTVDKVKVLIEQNDEVITTDYIFIYYIQTDRQTARILFIFY